MQNKIKVFLKNNYLIIFITLASAFLIFKNLSNMYLWQDEACVALIAKNVLKTGLPLVYNGTHWLTSIPLEIIRNLYVDTQTWLEYYIGALSFLIFGINTFSARFPFALFGLGGVIFSYFFYKKLSSKKTAILSTFLLAFSIPYILYARQCSFYGMVPVLVMATLFFYLKFINSKKEGIPGLIILGALLYYTFFVMFFILFAAILLHFFIFGFYKKKLKELYAILVILGALIIPSFIFINPFFRISSGRTANISEFIIKLKSYLLWINNYIFPFAVALFFLILKAIKSNFNSIKKIALFFLLIVMYFLVFFLLVEKKSSAILMLILGLFIIFGSFFINKHYLFIKNYLIRNNIFVLLFLFIIINFIAVTIASDAPYFRYLYSALPILVFFLGAMIYKISSGKIWIVSFFSALIIFCNILSVAPLYISNKLTKGDEESLSSFSDGIYRDLKNDTLRSDFINYLYEITHDYSCPVKGIVTYLNQNALPGDIVKASYNDFPLQFYTKLHIINWKDPGGKAPDWIIPVSNIPVLTNEEFLKSIEGVKYDKIELDYPNICYSNLPEPLYHNFKTISGYMKPIYSNFSGQYLPSKVILLKKR